MLRKNRRKYNNSPKIKNKNKILNRVLLLIPSNLIMLINLRLVTIKVIIIIIRVFKIIVMYKNHLLKIITVPYLLHLIKSFKGFINLLALMIVAIGIILHFNKQLIINTTSNSNWHKINTINNYKKRRDKWNNKRQLKKRLNKLN